MDPSSLLRTRHRYQSFSQRIAKVKANFTDSTELNYFKPKDENSTFFYEALKETCQTCLDPFYSQFVSSILRYSRTLSLIVHNEKFIFQAFLNFLNHSFEECAGGIEDVMELLTCLSRDLRSEFYYFKSDWKTMF